LILEAPLPQIFWIETKNKQKKTQGIIKRKEEREGERERDKRKKQKKERGLGLGLEREKKKEGRERWGCVKKNDAELCGASAG
jgi:hypothetical protein